MTLNFWNFKPFKCSGNNKCDPVNSFHANPLAHIAITGCYVHFDTISDCVTSCLSESRLCPLSFYRTVFYLLVLWVSWNVTALIYSSLNTAKFAVHATTLAFYTRKNGKYGSIVMYPGNQPTNTLSHLLLCSQNQHLN